MTLGAGSSSLAFTLLSRSGAETGGGTMLALLTTGTRMLANSRWALVGAGGTMLESSWGVLRILSRETCGAGGIRGAVNRGTARIWSRDTSGVGATTLICGSAAADRFDFRPWVGAA